MQCLARRRTWRRARRPSRCFRGGAAGPVILRPRVFSCTVVPHRAMSLVSMTYTWCGCSKPRVCPRCRGRGYLIRNHGDTAPPPVTLRSPFLGASAPPKQPPVSGASARSRDLRSAYATYRRTHRRMHRFTVGSRSYWVGYHFRLGFLVYDVQLQLVSLLPPDRVRLYKLSDRKPALFDVAVIRTPRQWRFETRFIDDMPAAVKRYLGQRALWLARLSRRTGPYPHCYGCKRSLRLQPSSVCTSCSWLRCSFCGACGCAFKR